jgi:hypothetical protein
MLEVLVEHVAGSWRITAICSLGPSGTDTIPAWLSPGEFVLKKSAVDRFGLDTLNSMNRFDTGGIVGQTSIPSGPHQRANQTGQVVHQNAITVNVQGGTGSSDKEDGKKMLAAMNLVVQEAIETAQRPGGRLWKAGQK